MLNQEVVKLLNKQINKELFSAYLYFDMSNYYFNQGLDGFANWFKIQAQEERDHALLFTEYLQNNGAEVVLETIAQPTHTYPNYKAPLVEALEHERFVTNSIHHIYDVASSVKDFRTLEFLNWFVKEQGEEEKNAEGLIVRYDLFAQDGKGLYLLDNELKTRVYQAPSLVLD